MYEITYSAQSRKSFRKLRGSGRFDEQAVAFVINELLAGNLLAVQYRTHLLHGEYAGCFECHIKSNLLLIYKVEETDKVITIIDIGSHSDLFG